MSTPDFSNFVFDRLPSPMEYSDGLMWELLDRAGVEYENRSNAEALGELVGALGKNKVLRDNTPINFLTTDEMADYLDRAGTQKALSRSLWSPEFEPNPNATTIITGGVANWQDRTADLLTDDSNLLPQKVYIAVGSRVMKSATEITNPNVILFEAKYNELPTENKYAEHVIVPRLIEAGIDTTLATYETESGDDVASNFVTSYPRLFDDDKQVTVAKTAGAGWHLLLQILEAAKNHTSPRYNANPQAPQIFVRTDALPVARDGGVGQNPQTGLRQAVVTAKLLEEVF